MMDADQYCGGCAQDVGECKCEPRDAKMSDDITVLRELLADEKAGRRDASSIRALESAIKAIQAPVAPTTVAVPDGFVVVDISLIDDECLNAAMRDADIMRRVCADDSVVISAAIHAYLIAASQREGGVT